MNIPWWVWLAVIAAIIAIFTFSLFVGRKAHEITPGEAGRWVAGYVSLAILFGIGIWITAGSGYAGQFFAGYMTEYALSVDNLFVFAIILTAFKVPKPLQGKVVLIGIAIALVLRGGLIAGGAALIHHFSWAFYIFGAILLITAVNLLRSKSGEEESVPGTVRILRRIMPMSHEYEGTKFLTRVGGHRVATPLLAVIVALGVTDLVFALDSIPAIFGLTKEAFLVFTANAFALLGLSELYFLLGALLDRLRYLGKGLAFILLFIAAKLIFEAMAENNLPFLAGGEPIEWAPEFTPLQSLIAVGSILGIAIIASLIAQKVHPEHAGEPGTIQQADAGSAAGTAARPDAGSAAGTAAQPDTGSAPAIGAPSGATPATGAEPDDSAAR